MEKTAPTGEIAAEEIERWKHLASVAVRERSSPPKCCVCGRDLAIGRCGLEGTKWACYEGSSKEPDTASQIDHADRSMRYNPLDDSLSVELGNALPRLLSALAAKDAELERLRSAPWPGHANVVLAAYRAAETDPHCEVPHEDMAELIDRTVRENDELRAELAARKRRIESLTALLRSVLFEGLSTEGLLIPSPSLRDALREARAALAAEGTKK